MGVGGSLFLHLALPGAPSGTVAPAAGVPGAIVVVVVAAAAAVAVVFDAKVLGDFG